MLETDRVDGPEETLFELAFPGRQVLAGQRPPGRLHHLYRQEAKVLPDRPHDGLPEFRRLEGLDSCAHAPG